MIQMFHSCGMLELWLNPLVGQPPALLYSDIAQMITSRMLTTAYENACIRKRRLRSICLTASSRSCCSSPVGTFESITAGFSLAVCWVGIASLPLVRPQSASVPESRMGRRRSSVVRSSQRRIGTRFGHRPHLPPGTLLRAHWGAATLKLAGHSAEAPRTSGRPTLGRCRPAARRQTSRRRGRPRPRQSPPAAQGTPPLRRHVDDGTPRKQGRRLSASWVALNALAPQRTLFASAPLLVRARGAFGGYTGIGRRSGRRASSLMTIPPS